MKIGQKIKAIREEKGMTLEQLGDKVGVGKSTVRKWEEGMIKNMRRDKIKKISDALDISPAYLMGWEEREFNPETAELVYKVRDDAELIEALKKYFALSEEQKKHIIELINMLSKKEG